MECEFPLPRFNTAVRSDRLLGTESKLSANSGQERSATGFGCQGSQTIAAIRRLAPSKATEREVFFENAKKLLRI
jgi:hypothetical protein